MHNQLAVVKKAGNSKLKRWENTYVKDQDLTVYEMVMRYTRKLTVEEKEEIKMVKLQNKINASKELAVRNNLLTQLGNSAIDNGVLDLFTSSDGDLGSDGLFGVTTITSSHDKIEPYQQAYKVSKKSEWLPTHIADLYKLISMFGADAFLIQSQLPEFTEKQVRARMNLERRRHPELYIAACERHEKINIDALEHKYAITQQEIVADPLFNFLED